MNGDGFSLGEVSCWLLLLDGLPRHLLFQVFLALVRMRWRFSFCRHTAFSEMSSSNND
jgi:hypothetical protein